MSNDVSRSASDSPNSASASFGVGAGGPAQGVEVGLQVADRPVGGDEVVDVRLLEAVDDRGRPFPALASLSADRIPPLLPSENPWKNARHVGSTPSGLSSHARCIVSMTSALARVGSVVEFIRACRSVATPAFGARKGLAPLCMG
jgi:hypothetical protein